jgi:uncharacterized protein YceH (UPF0502 family)
MDILLADTEVRVLGCLLEKEMATPEYYPLSLNGLMNACNQKSNRNPVAGYDEYTVEEAVAGLKEKGLVRQSNVSRVPKYEQNFTIPRKLVNREAAVLCVLLLRGPQTVGEIRGRTERLYKFAGLEETEETVGSLADLGYVVQLPRQPGRKESRYMHLLAGEPMVEQEGDTRPGPVTIVRSRGVDERIAALAEEVDELGRELQVLKQAFAEFKGQFD